MFIILDKILRLVSIYLTFSKLSTHTRLTIDTADRLLIYIYFTFLIFDKLSRYICLTFVIVDKLLISIRLTLDVVG